MTEKNFISFEEVGEIWEEIKKFIKSKAGPSLEFNFENNSPLITGVVTSSIPKVLGKTKNCVQSLGLPIRKNGKKHGKGRNMLVQIILNQITTTDAERIKEKINKYFNPKKMQKSVVCEPEKIVSLETTEKKIRNPRKWTGASIFRQSISRMLPGICKADGKKIVLRYLTDKEDGFQTVEVDNEDNAKKLLLFFRWAIGFSDSTMFIQSGTTLIVNCKDFQGVTVGKKNFYSFCFPPEAGATQEDIEKRLKRISPGSNPIIKTCNDSLQIHYTRKSFIPKIFPELKAMSWPVEMDNDGTHIKILVDPNGKSSEKSIVITETAPLTTTLSEKEEKLKEMLENPLLKLEVKQKIEIYFREQEAENINKQALAILAELTGKK